MNIGRDNGYPLCAETLELLHKNVQLLETVLNGLKLPQHTIVRFPAVNGVSFAYVQNTSDRGELLQIGNGAALASSSVTNYQITETDQDITDSTDNPYPAVYQERRLNLMTIGHPSSPVSVVGFDEVIEPAMFEQHSLRNSNPYLGQENTEYLANKVTGTPVIKVQSNDRELRIRICLNVENLEIRSNSEFRMVFSSDRLDNIGDVFPIWASLNGNDSNINKHVGTDVCKKGDGYFQVKVFTHELYDAGNVTSFTGQISVNAVIFIGNQAEQGVGAVTEEIG